MAPVPTASCLSGAELVLVDGLGHGLPQGLIEHVIDPGVESITETQAKISQIPEVSHGTT